MKIVRKYWVCDRLTQEVYLSVLSQLSNQETGYEGKEVQKDMVATHSSEEQFDYIWVSSLSMPKKTQRTRRPAHMSQFNIFLEN